MTSGKKALLAAVVLLITSGCQTTGSVEPSLTPAPLESASPTFTSIPTIISTPTPLPPIPEPEPPESEYSSVYGRVLWQGQPAEGVRVSVFGFTANNDFGIFDDDTDADGFFLIENIPAPTVDYLFRASSAIQPDWMDGLSIGADQITLELTPGENFAIGDYVLIDSGLSLIAPERDSTISGQAPLLRWEGYPGADYYVVRLNQSFGDFSNLEVETTGTELRLEEPLINCLYGWDVSAFSGDGTLLARSDQYAEEGNEFQAEFDGIFQFEGEGLPPCQMEILKPFPYQTFPVSGGWEIEWELIPWAVAYQVVIRQTHDARGQVNIYPVPTGRHPVDENGQPVDFNLPTLTQGSYLLYVVAYAEDGSILAQTEERSISVR